MINSYNKKIKVLHVVGGFADGGAARGATNLHNAMIKKGMCSYILYGYFNLNEVPKNSMIRKSLLQFISFRILFFLDQLLAKFYLNRKKILFSSGLIGFNLNKIIKKYDINIINLHWVNYGMISIKQISKIDIPIIWTLRDAWCFTGGCHVPMNCVKYENECSKCPQLNSTNKRDLSNQIFLLKSKEYKKIKKIKFVAISKQLANQAEKSKLINQPIQTIPNLIDFEQLNSKHKLYSRKKLKLKNKPTILFQNTSGEFWKGTENVEKIIDYLGNKYQFTSFGHGRGYSGAVNLGYTKNRDLLSNFYSSADIFVFLTKYEPFGKVLFEAAWCGTRVVSFKNTGTYDLYENDSWWTILSSDKINHICDKIKISLNQKNIDTKVIQRKILQKIDENQIIDSYKKIYKNLLN